MSLVLLPTQISKVTVETWTKGIRIFTDPNLRKRVKLKCTYLPTSKGTLFNPYINLYVNVTTTFHKEGVSKDLYFYRSPDL